MITPVAASEHQRADRRYCVDAAKLNARGKHEKIS
jgi:hypothetical protein